MTRGRVNPWWMLIAALAFCLPSAALAKDVDDEEDELLIEDEDPDAPAIDNLEIYRAFKSELKGLPIEEELDAWYRYLGNYPKTPYKREIGARIEELETAMFEETELDAPEWSSQEETGRGAKYDEMPFIEPFGFMTINTRKKAHLALAYGYSSTFNYNFGLEWAFKRNFSVFGHALYQGHEIGFMANIGVKYAIVKDTRTGGLFVVGAQIKGGADHGLSIGIDPFIGIGANPQGGVATFQFKLGYDMRFTPWHWDLHAGLNLGLRASDTVVIFFETTGHNYLRKVTDYEAPTGEVCGDDSGKDEHCVTEYLGFYEGVAGVKILPRENVEITIALRAPYFYRKWQYYTPLGGGASVMIYF